MKVWGCGGITEGDRQHPWGHQVGGGLEAPHNGLCPADPLSRIQWLLAPAVITSKDLQKHGNIWVCPVSDHVCTRFFFV